MKAIRSIVIISGVWLLTACGQGPEANSDLTSASEAEEPTGVKNCLSLGRACKADAATAPDLAACQEQVRACFANFVHDDGGLRPGCDATRPPDNNDAGPGPRIGADGGRRAAIQACLTTLRDCIVGGTDPITCGQDARTCLEQVFH